MLFRNCEYFENGEDIITDFFNFVEDFKDRIVDVVGTTSSEVMTLFLINL